MWVSLLSAVRSLGAGGGLFASFYSLLSILVKVSSPHL